MGYVSQSSQYLRADKLIEIVCKVGDVSYATLISKEKNTKLNVLRGLIYYYSRELKIHPSVIARMVLRTRCNVITMCSRYRHYIKIGDKSTAEYSNTIAEDLKNENIDTL